MPSRLVVLIDYAFLRNDRHDSADFDDEKKFAISLKNTIFLTRSLVDADALHSASLRKLLLFTSRRQFTSPDIDLTKFGLKERQSEKKASTTTDAYDEHGKAFH